VVVVVVGVGVVVVVGVGVGVVVGVVVVRRHPNRPPVRRCELCGGDYVAWAPGGMCPRCKGETAPDRVALTDKIRGRRELPSAGPGASSAPVPYNEFPPGF
jgi:hypothetical protein